MPGLDLPLAGLGLGGDPLPQGRLLDHALEVAGKGAQSLDADWNLRLGGREERIELLVELAGAVPRERGRTALGEPSGVRAGVSSLSAPDAPAAGAARARLPARFEGACPARGHSSACTQALVAHGDQAPEERDARCGVATTDVGRNGPSERRLDAGRAAPSSA